MNLPKRVREYFITQQTPHKYQQLKHHLRSHHSITQPEEQAGFLAVSIFSRASC